MWKRVAAGVSLGLWIMGCLSMTTADRVLQNETAETLRTKITEGKTTKPEIKALFGAPSQVSFTTNGLEIYHYEVTEAKARLLNVVPVPTLGVHGYKGTKKALEVVFDKHDVVTHYSLATSAVEVRPGLSN
jgi:hypothetical protein